MLKWSPRRVAWGTAVTTFLLYWLTMPRDLTWQFSSGDGGELITAAVTLGIPHPPGYPTYVLLGKLWSYLPIDPAAYRFHLFSALCAAGAAGLVTATAQTVHAKARQDASPLLASVVGLLFALSPLVWQQAVVAEVYSLNLLLVAAFLWALLAERPSPLTGLLLGLSFTTHLTSLFLIPLALRLTPAKSWSRLAVGTAVGLTPFLLLPVLAWQGSPVIWGNPTTVRGWLWLVTAQIYQGNQFALPATEIGPRLATWGNIFLQQLAIVGWPLLVYAGWLGKHGRSPQKKQGGWLGGTAVAYLVYAFFYQTTDAIVLTLPAWLLLSLCLAPALPRMRKWTLILPGAAVLLHLLGNNGANIHNIRVQADHILNATPSEAILVTSGDPDIFAMWYFHYVENQRPDVILVDSALLAFDWYRHNLAQQYPDLRVLSEDNLALFETENQLHRAVCYAHFNVAPGMSETVRCLEGSN